VDIKVCGSKVIIGFLLKLIKTKFLDIVEPHLMNIEKLFIISLFFAEIKLANCWKIDNGNLREKIGNPQI
jgi:hypothetical protein